MNKNLKFLSLLFAILTIVSDENLYAQNDTNSGDHEFTMFLIRSGGNIDWESPSTLYETVLKTSLKAVLNSKKDMHIFGHAVMVMTSPLLGSDTIWLGVNSDSKTRQEVDLVLKEKMGLGALGVSFPAKLEGRDRILTDIRNNNLYTEVKFVKFLLSDESAKQIIEFHDYYHKSYKDSYEAPSYYYGVQFWPLYEGEGAACSSICLASLESGGIFMSDELQNEWMVKLKIPINLVGGRFRNNEKIKVSKVKKTKSWYEGDGVPNEDYIDFELYDVNYMLDWVNREINDENRFVYMLRDDLHIDGLQFDFRDVKPHLPLEDIIRERKDPSPFVTNHLENLVTLPQQVTD